MKTLRYSGGVVIALSALALWMIYSAADRITFADDAFVTSSSCRINITAPPSISTCNLEADQRGPNQDVVAYSLFADDAGRRDEQISKRYFASLDARAGRIAEAYPGKKSRCFFFLSFGGKLINFYDGSCRY